MASLFHLREVVMISTKNLISQLEDIPIEWVFEYYLKLSEKLTGQSIKMKSIFNLINFFTIFEHLLKEKR